VAAWRAEAEVSGRRRGFKGTARASKPRKIAGRKNRTESEYEDLHLRARQAAGEVVCWWYEEWTFKLANDVRFTPDYAVLLTNGVIEIVEVKGGFIRDDARVKLRAAADRYPFRFIMAQKQPKKHGGGWTLTEIASDGWAEAA
jgi:hypothetical protein